MEYNYSENTADWVVTASDREAVKLGCYFDIKAALRFKEFAEEFCTQSKGVYKGKKFTFLPWQWNKVIAPLFGWKQADGTRRFNRLYLYIPKKNGKSTLASVIALYLLIADDENGAEVYLAASSKDQTGIVFDEIKNIIAESEDLQQDVNVIAYKKLIEFDTSKIKCITREHKSNEGMNIHGLIFDEIHTQKSYTLWNALRYGGAARRQPLTVCISTVGEFDDSQLWYEQFETAKKIQSSEIVNVHTLGLAYYADKDDDIHNEETWRKANPSYDTILNKSEFRQAYNDALTNGANMSAFLRYRLNYPTANETVWIANNFWVKTVKDNPKKHDFSKYDIVVCGMDAATSFDINAAVYLARKIKKTDKDITTRYTYHADFWIPDTSKMNAINKPNRDKYDKWVAENFIKKIDGPIIDKNIVINDIVNRMLEFKEKGVSVHSIALDRFQAVQIAYDLEQALQKAKLKTEVIAVGYNCVSMHEPTEKLSEAIIKGELSAQPNPVMDWMFTNITITQDSNGNNKINKSNPKNKVDGFAAMTIAYLALHMHDVSKRKKNSKYNDPETKLTTVEV